MPRRHCAERAVTDPSSTSTARTPARSVSSSGCVARLRLSSASIVVSEFARAAIKLKTVKRPSGSSSEASSGRQCASNPRCNKLAPPWEGRGARVRGWGAGERVRRRVDECVRRGAGEGEARQRARPRGGEVRRGLHAAGLVIGLRDAVPLAAPARMHARPRRRRGRGSISAPRRCNRQSGCRWRCGRTRRRSARASPAQSERVEGGRPRGRGRGQRAWAETMAVRAGHWRGQWSERRGERGQARAMREREAGREQRPRMVAQARGPHLIGELRG